MRKILLVFFLFTGLQFYGTAQTAMVQHHVSHKKVVPKKSKKDRFKIVPEASAESVQVFMENKAGVSFIVYNSKFEKLSDFKLKENDEGFLLNIKNLERGNYYLQINEKQNNYIKHFTKI